MDITLVGRNRNLQEETTSYWFVLDGVHAGTGKEFVQRTIGVIDRNGERTYVDIDGYEIPESFKLAAVMDVLEDVVEIEKGKVHIEG